MLLSRTLAFPHPSQIPELPSLSQGDSQGLQMESLSNGLSEKSWVKGLFTACVGNDGEAQDLATGMPAAAPGLRAGQRAWWPHPQRMTPREELEARWSSTFLSDLLRGDRAGQFAQGSDVCPRQMGWPPSTALHLSLVWAHLFLFGAAFPQCVCPSRFHHTAGGGSVARMCCSPVA